MPVSKHVHVCVCPSVLRGEMPFVLAPQFRGEMPFVLADMELWVLRMHYASSKDACTDHLHKSVHLLLNQYLC